MALSCKSIALLYFACLNSAATNWNVVRSTLISKQNAFNQNNFNEYAFSYRTVCMCMPCDTTTKYNSVQNDKSIDTTFSDPSLNCDTTSLYDPDYRTINDWFNVAIDYVDAWSGCDGVATQVTAGPCTDVSLDVVYDETYNFPISIIFDQAAMAYDGGMAWYFDCFDAYSNGIKVTDSSGAKYTRSCLYFTPSFPSTPDTTSPVNTSTSSNIWDGIKAKLIQQQQIFNAHGLTQYVYSQQKSCECMECGTMKKFSTVNDENVDVTFDKNDYGCTSNDLYDPDYRTINDWFNVAIEYCEKWRYCDEITTTKSGAVNYCEDKSLDVTYDETYGYPTEIIFDRVAMAYDGGDMYMFGCFTPYNNGEVVNTPVVYTRTCDFIPTFPNFGGDATTTSEPYQIPSNGHRIWFQMIGLMEIIALFVV